MIPGVSLSTTVQSEFMTPLSGDKTTTRTLSQEELESPLPLIMGSTSSQDDFQTCPAVPKDSTFDLDKTTNPCVKDHNVNTVEIESIHSIVLDLIIGEDASQTPSSDVVHAPPPLVQASTDIPEFRINSPDSRFANVGQAGV